MNFLYIFQFLNTTTVKALVGGYFSIGTIKLFQSNDIRSPEDFIGAAMSSNHSEVMLWTGSILSICYTIYTITNWYITIRKKWKLSDLEVAKDQENLKQEIIDTDIKSQERNGKN